MDRQMLQQFETNREALYNQNTKGGNYEKIVGKTLETYLGTQFDFYYRAQLIDMRMEYLNVFSVGQNEFDVVAAFKTASPRLVLKIEDTPWVPLDSIAFCVEVKQDATTSSVESDLGKLGLLDKLPRSPNRVGVSLGGNFNIQRPLKILFYYERKIDWNKLDSLLAQQIEHWDMVIFLKEDFSFLNPSLPVAKIVRDSGASKLKEFQQHSLLFLLFVVTASLPVPMSVSTLDTFLNILRLSEGGSPTCFRPSNQRASH
jgi:hypothetical protein